MGQNKLLGAALTLCWLFDNGQGDCGVLGLLQLWVRAQVGPTTSHPQRRADAFRSPGADLQWGEQGWETSRATLVSGEMEGGIAA